MSALCTMALGDDEILHFYEGPGAVEVWYNGTSAPGIFDEGQERPVNTAGGVALASMDVLRFVRSTLPDVARETEIIIDGGTYLVRDVRRVNRLEDEAIVVPKG